ncbi:MAG: L,D-transpeptidase family protein [Patescibacteria group bacterium]|nr:MAG: L,D-transpeptidase family protein [Patescibacteria group bacterium]
MSEDFLSFKNGFVLAALCFLLAAPVSAAEPSAFDTDGDGYDDATEMANGYTPYGPGRLETHDADGDELTDADELIFGTDPLAPDSDRDGYRDGEEVRHGYDPAKGSSARLQKRIVITLATQTLAYSIGPKQLGTFEVSTGRPGYPTPLGTFAIRDKIPRAWSNSAKLWMPYWMPFIGTTYGLHELPEWPGGKKEGEDSLGTPVSGGCVRLGVGSAKTLYEWAEVGTEVTINKT